MLTIWFACLMPIAWNWDHGCYLFGGSYHLVVVSAAAMVGVCYEVTGWGVLKLWKDGGMINKNSIFADWSLYPKTKIMFSKSCSALQAPLLSHNSISGWIFTVQGWARYDSMLSLTHGHLSESTNLDIWYKSHMRLMAISSDMPYASPLSLAVHWSDLPSRHAEDALAAPWN